MTKISQLIQEYFVESSPPRRDFLMTESAGLPIVPDKITWEIVSDPERLMRRFEFSNRSKLIDFLGEIFELEDEMNHHAKITVDHLHVDIEIYTKSINCVTELDLEYSKTSSQIYEDVMHYGYTSER